MAPKRAPLSLKLCVPLLVGIGWLMNVDFGTKRAKEGVLFLASLSAGLFATLYRRCMKSIEERASPTDTVCIVVDGKAELKTVLDHDKEALVELLSQGLLGYLVALVAYRYFRVTPPLLMQTLLQPLNIFEHAVFQVHVMGADDSKPPYERPWASMLPQRQWEQYLKDLDEKRKAQEARERRAQNGLVKPATKKKA